MKLAPHYDVAILGAGMSGLAAGIRLAHFEKKVCVLEKHTIPGGLNSYYRRAGHDIDVGLHAMTNYVRKDVRNAPLNKLLRQLRLDYDQLALCPQRGSAVRFPGVSLRFNNDFELFQSEVREKFPRQTDAFQRLAQHIQAYNEVDLNAQPLSARAVVAEFLSDPLLIEMLFCPLLFYGSACEDDIDFSQFVIMFKSIFREGMSRPKGGMRRVVGLLLERYRTCGGELHLNTGVRRLGVADERVATLELENGAAITADIVLSSAGSVETDLLCSDLSADRREQITRTAGRMTFVESISILDTPPAALGLDTSILFFSTAERLRYRPSQELADPTSGVVCCPDNFEGTQGVSEPAIRLTNIANYERWAKLGPEEYRAQKTQCYERGVSALKEVADFRSHVTFSDVFTPRTIHRFTGHVNGAVYGTPQKVRTGRTRLKNLFLCGTDQGFLGIVGAMLSGISMANLHVLQPGRLSEAKS